MMNYFTFGSIDSRTYGVYIASSNLFDAPAEDVDTITIPGRNGVMYRSNGRYLNFKMKLLCYVQSNMRTYVDSFRAALLAVRSAQKYTESERPGEYRIARFLSAYALGDYDHVGANFVLEFDCRPERWLEIEPSTITSSTNFTNPTKYDAKPIITVNMASGSSSGNVYVSRYVSGTRKDQWKVSFSDIESDLIMNCETMDFYDSNGNNLNSNVTVLATVTSGEIDMQFPFFAGGSLSRIFTVTDGWDPAIASINVNPRWWSI